MKESVTFAVDATGLSHYVEVSPAMRTQLSLDEAGAVIDEWPGDFPGDFKPGIYSAVLEVTGSLENPDLKWTKITKLTALPPWARVQSVPEFKEKERKPKKKKEAPKLEVRVRRDGQVL